MSEVNRYAVVHDLFDILLVSFGVTGIPPTKELSTALKAAAADIDDFLAGTSVEKMMSVKERILAVDPSLAEDAEKDTVACESTPKMPEANWVPGPKGLQ